MSEDDERQLSEVASILRSGGLVGIPTETVYGLAANALDGTAVKRIFEVKGRPQDNPLIVHISRFEELAPLVDVVPEKAARLADAFWPGPLTMVMKRSDAVPDEVSCGLPTVAVRMPSHKIANAIIKAAGLPLAAPSANTSGKPSPTCAAHVLQDMNGKIEGVVDGGICEVGIESTVITLCTKTPTLLRPGAVTLRQLADTIGDVEVHRSVFSDFTETARPASPGMKYRHYSPKAEVVVVDGALGSFIEYVNKQSAGSAVLCFEGEESSFPDAVVFSFGAKEDSRAQAQRLYSALRKADELKIKRIFARLPDTDGMGTAVCNRLLRAAAFKVVKL